MFKRLAAATAAFMVMSGSAWAQEVTLKLSFFGPPQDPTYSQTILPWAEAVNEAGKGVVQIDVFPGGALVPGPPAQAKAVSDGVADIGFVVPSYTPGRFPDNEVMELPGVVQNVKESSIAFNRLLQRGLLRGYDDFHVLMVMTTHPYAIHTVDPVSSIGDLAGLKLRAGGPVASAAVTALGATPVGMPIPAVAENISKGVLDGTGAEWNVMYAFRINEVATNHFMMQLGPVPLALVMNKDAYDALPDAAKAILDENAGESLARQFGDVQLGIQTSRLASTQEIDGHNFVFPNDAQQAEIDSIMQGVIDEWTASHPNGATLLAALNEELGKIRAE